MLQAPTREPTNLPSWSARDALPAIEQVHSPHPDLDRLLRVGWELGDGHRTDRVLPALVDDADDLRELLADPRQRGHAVNDDDPLALSSRSSRSRRTSSGVPLILGRNEMQSLSARALLTSSALVRSDGSLSTNTRPPEENSTAAGSISGFLSRSRSRAAWATTAFLNASMSTAWTVLDCNRRA